MSIQGNALDRLLTTSNYLHAEHRLAVPGGSVSAASVDSLQVTGLGPHVRIGEFVRVATGQADYLGEVISASNEFITVKLLDSNAPRFLGARVWHHGPLLTRPDVTWRGRVMNCLAQPIDGKGELNVGSVPYTLSSASPPPLSRARIDRYMPTGIRVIDAFTPLCLGQRVGLFAGTGVGKSTLLSMLSRTPGFGTVVLALVGERGREVAEFLDELRARVSGNVITVVSTSDESPGKRRLAALQAMTIAEYFRDRNEHVLLLIDSVTRFAHAAREIYLTAGEPPVARGYPPSALGEIPRLLERAGTTTQAAGTITAILSVLVDSDDFDDPVVDTIRGTIDGHIVLDRKLADQGQYPAVNPLKSLSRLAHIAWSDDERQKVTSWKKMITQYEDTRELRMMGGLLPGADPQLDRAIQLVPKLFTALAQTANEPQSKSAIAELDKYLAS